MHQLGIKLAKEILNGKLSKNLLFSGEMGVGKTTLIQSIAKELGVTETVTSPSFALLEEYDLDNKFSKFVHGDLWRLKQGDTALSLPELQAVLTDKKAIVCLEWGEYAPTELAKQAVLIKLKLDKNNHRIVSYEA